MTTHIHFQQDDNGVAQVTFNRPEALNALSLEMMQTFAQHVEALANDDTVRVVVLSGAGTRAFCSGGDLVELSNYPDEAGAREFITLMGDALLTLEALPVPVIAAMNGYALGGGSEIALACDMRVVDEQIKMGMVQIKMALTPGWGAGQRLLRLVGYSKAMALLLSGDVLRADAVQSLGLANRVVAAGEAVPEALTWAREIASQPPDVVQSIKALLRAGLTQPYPAALDTERELFPALWAADAHLQAVETFLQRQRDKSNDAS